MSEEPEEAMTRKEFLTLLLKEYPDTPDEGRDAYLDELIEAMRSRLGTSEGSEEDGPGEERGGKTPLADDVSSCRSEIFAGF